ncbi:DegT/DnrJ/EryC1/StrS family aminotransferase [Microbacterium sp. NPDC019599]|uniref:DegT/DnrJ/EryC1/StrS family aminotransferase n=1 Tax=Microbacterium sp. NPDC019599 TaxID=3154690 RepID=UPI0034021EC6
MPRAQAGQPVAHYERTDTGYRYRMSNLLAALGGAQLSGLDEKMARRRTARAGYRELFAKVHRVEVWGSDDDEADDVWLTSILIDKAVPGGRRKTFRPRALSRTAIAAPWKPCICTRVSAPKGM